MINAFASSWTISYKYTNVEADALNLNAESWKDYTADMDLDVGVYYVYAIIGETDNYLQSYSEVCHLKFMLMNLKDFQIFMQLVMIMMAHHINLTLLLLQNLTMKNLLRDKIIF